MKFAVTRMILICLAGGPIQEQACSTCVSFGFFATFVLFRETERLWENWLITKIAFPSPRCDMSHVRLVGTLCITCVQTWSLAISRAERKPQQNFSCARDLAMRRVINNTDVSIETYCAQSLVAAFGKHLNTFFS